ncbi:glycosyltransferase family 2 protein [Minwuia sp.]|uniref:glycosyltransferase family 2 protein n=1 Tax=Minwuia sp. TaxID=2493630 RepID=UPI003A8E46EC
MTWTGFAVEWLLPAANVIMLMILATGVFQYTLYFAQMLVAFIVLRQERAQRRALRRFELTNRILPPVSIIVPAFNEADHIVDNINSMLALDYASLEIVVVDDGSTDDMFAEIDRHFELEEAEMEIDEAFSSEEIHTTHLSRKHPNLVVIRKENGGRADALNAGLAVSRAPFFCALDADSMLERDALHRAVGPFVHAPDKVIAVGGTLRVANGSMFVAGRLSDVRLPGRLLPLIQTLEYLRSFLMARLSWSRFNTVICVSGAFGVFLKEPVRDIGGFRPGAAGEDMDLVVRLHRLMRDRDRAYLIHYIAEPVCWTHVPETWRDFASQRIRWQRGALEVFFRNADMLVKPRYGRVGWFGLLHGFILDVASPVLEVLGYVLFPLLWIFGLLNQDYAFAFIAIVFAFGFFISVLGIVMDEIELKRVTSARQLLTLLGVAAVENVGFRQYHNICRFIGTWQYLRGVRGWKNG